ncbi:hypothetical protein [Tsukamurella pseudospumae]|uniref:Uncharacterized protein n=1 Tax=Tsukamurella pseudospumae TaxID=239498 RepID=A0A138ADX2_9ACTN|nr:hypothetical protein [Tsukamurella pseudospumae]KXP08698.1 hypothetical protein AXK60_08470 [Tsukamurella pseudospumae]
MYPAPDPNAEEYKVGQEYLELSEALFRLVEAHDTARASVGQPYRPKSRAATDFDNQEQFRGSASEGPVEDLQAEAGFFLARADDHMRALAMSIATERVAHSVFTLARVVLAASSFAYSLLDPDPSIGTAQRIVKYHNFELHSLYEIRPVVWQHDSDLEAEIDDRVDTLLSQASLLGVKHVKAGGRTYLDPAPFSEREMVISLLERTKAIKRPKRQPMRAGDIVYSVLSASVHAQPHMRTMFDFVELPRRVPDRKRIGERTSIETMARVARLAFMGYHAAHERHRDYFGLPRLAKIRTVKRDAQVIDSFARVK